VTTEGESGAAPRRLRGRESLRGSWPWACLLALGFSATLLHADTPRPEEDPPRLQWVEEGGYCGETAIQTLALRFGLWVSQAEVRRLAGGEVLLGVNEARALRQLHLGFSGRQPAGRPRPRLRAFLAWLRRNLLQGRPCLVGVYVLGGTHTEYDHIVPVVAVRPGRVEAEDLFAFHSLFSLEPVWKRAGDLGVDRGHCTTGLVAGGNLPDESLYGVAVRGFVDGQGRGVAVRLAVDRPDEPDPYRGEAPCALKARLSLSGLRAGRRFLIQRLDIPAQGAWPGTGYRTCVSFVATGATESWLDPEPIRSDGTTRYRCLPAKGAP